MLKTIPVAVLTSSEAERDMVNAYANDVNCYITKPLDFEKFVSATLSIDGYYLAVVNSTEDGS